MLEAMQEWILEQELILEANQMLEATLEVKAMHHQDVNSKRIFIEYPFILCYYNLFASYLY